MNKKHRNLIIIGLILLSILIVLILVSNQKDLDSEYSTKKENIQSPYVIQDLEMTIDLQDNSSNVPDKGKILKVLGFNTKVLNPMISNFYTDQKEWDFSQEMSFQFDTKDFFFYSPSTGIFSLSSEKGVKFDLEISSEETLTTFIQEYLGVQRVIILEQNNSQDTIEYMGRYILKDIEIGSSYLDGYSFSFVTDKDGNVLNLSILLLAEENIEKYEYLPLSSIETLISSNYYPKMIGRNEIEERFYEQPSPYELTELYVTEIEMLYLFNDYENGFILPTYKLTGEGRIVAEKGKFWSNVDIFICAVDPEYLIEREDSTNEDTYQNDPSPYHTPE